MLIVCGYCPRQQELVSHGGGTSQVEGGGVQCLRIHLPVQRMQVRSLVKDAAGQLNWHVQQKNPRAATKTRCSQKKGSVSREESEHGPALREPVLAALPATLYPPTPHHFPILPPRVRPRKENNGYNNSRDGRRSGTELGGTSTIKEQEERTGTWKDNQESD